MPAKKQKSCLTSLSRLKGWNQDYVTVIIEDNDQDHKEQIPKVFAKLLYGSRFHSLKQSRGQQGIGISAAVLYSQMTTGKHTKILSKTGLIPWPIIMSS